MVISLVVIVGISSTFVSQRKAYYNQEQISEMLQNARAAMDIMSSEVRMTGYGAAPTALSWIDWVSGVTFTTIPVLIEDGSGALGSDILHVAACFGEEATTTTLASAAFAGATNITVDSGHGSRFNTGSKKMISIIGLENAVVTGISGDTLTIDTDPATGGNQGLNSDYLAGDSVCIVKVISFSIVAERDGSKTVYTLKRNENLGAGRQPLAENITNLQVSLSGSTIEINPLTARTDKPDPDYAPNGGYRTTDLRSFITPPNVLIHTVGSGAATTATTTLGGSTSSILLSACKKKTISHNIQQNCRL